MQLLELQMKKNEFWQTNLFINNEITKKIKQYIMTLEEALFEKASFLNIDDFNDFYLNIILLVFISIV